MFAFLLLQMNPLYNTHDFSTFSSSRENTSDGCYKHHIEIEVLTAANDKSLLDIEIKNADPKKRIVCPDPVSNICLKMNGTMSWMKVRFYYHDDTGTEADV